jgi:hypothetical protein
VTTAVYSYWAGTRVAAGATEDGAWAVLAVLVVLSALIGWAMAGAIQRKWRLDESDHGLPSLSPGAWGKPDLAPPSTSPEVLVEVAELEALWRLSGRRGRPASSDWQL